MARLRTVITIDANGKPAARGIDQVEKATEKLDDEVKEVGKSFDDIADSASALPGPLGDIGSALSGPGGAVAAAGLLVGALGKAAQEAMVTGQEAQTTAAALNSTVEEASRLNEAFGQFGIEANDAVDIALQITGALDANVETAEKLGFAVGEAIDPIEGVKAAIDNWDLLTPIERMELFGEEGVRQIAKMQADGRSLSDIMDSISDGQLIDTAEAARLEELASKTRELTALWDGIKTEIGVSTVEGLTDVKALLEDIGSLFPEGMSEAILGETTGWDVFGELVKGSFVQFAGLLNDEVVGAVDTTNEKFKDLGDAAQEAGEDGETAGAVIGEAMVGTLSPIEVSKLALQDWADQLDIEAKANRMLEELGKVRDGTEEDMKAAELATIAWIDEFDEIPYEEMKNIQVAFAQGDIESVLRQIVLFQNAASQPVTMPVDVVWRDRRAPLPNAPIGFPEGNSTTVNISMAGQPSSRELSRMVDSWARNG